jgi:phosphatidate cytidylyltransferase
MIDTQVPKKSDLGVRTLSAIVMVAVAGAALWLGGWVFTAFVVAVGLGVIWEWWGLARLIAKTPFGAALWLAAGVSYVGFAMWVLLWLREPGAHWALLPIALVVAVDVGAYFAGRTFGGPKIAVRVSPSKTWAGLIGGAIAASIVTYIALQMLTALLNRELARADVAELSVQYFDFQQLLLVAAIGTAAAVVAQAGDFFESWMKRRAGVKDSGALIPGHGGLFDRVDGLLAVLFVGGLIYVLPFLLSPDFALTPSP